MVCSTFSFDLHVLGTPPALILSQDQTLVCNLLFVRNEQTAFTHSADTNVRPARENYLVSTLGLEPELFLLTTGTFNLFVKDRITDRLSGVNSVQTRAHCCASVCPRNL